MASLDFNALNNDLKGQLACTLAALILTDSKKNINSEEINKILKSANVEVPAHWPILFESALTGHNVTDLISGSGAQASGASHSQAPAHAQEKKEETKKAVKEEKPKEEEPEVDMDMGDLFG